MDVDNTSNKRIAKNIVILYFRMFLLLAIGLYTSRVNLQSLGVNNFGVYNVVAGFIVMFSSITGSLSNAISRFLMVELGCGNINKLKSVFSTSINVQLIFGLIIAIIGELAGLWFLSHKMQIPIESIYAAKWILHFSIVQFVIGLVVVPYNASIVAHEKLGAFAYISFLEASLKLLIAYAVFITPFNKLITFGILILISQFIIFLIYAIYCNRNFLECRYHLSFDKGLLKEISGFAGWNLIPNAAYVLNIQGTNILMNVYFGVVVNAARGIANQVNNAIYQFITNFMTAVVPQIMKSYATGDKQTAFLLACRSSKFSYYLMLLLSLPILLETDQILLLWLNNPPDYTSAFVRWQLVASMTMVFGNPLFNLMMADGRIKEFQIIMAMFTIIPFALSWVAYSFGLSVIIGYILYFLIYFILIPIRFVIVNRKIGLSSSDYMSGVVLKTFLVTILAIIIPTIFHIIMSGGIFRLLIVSIASVISTTLTIVFVGLTRSEKAFFSNKFKMNILRYSRNKF